MSRQNWSDDGYEEPLFIFPDDEDDAPSVSDGGKGAVPPASSGTVDYDMRGSGLSAGDVEYEGSGGEQNRRGTGAKAPVKYPEGSLGAFSTPEDYEGHEYDDQEYDDPILLFPPDEVEYDDEPEEKTKSRDSRSSGDGDLDDSIGISFSRYSAESKEGEFFFMPFLDIPDEVEDDEEEEGEEISFSFRKVDAEQVKKEKEFIFMPFLNASDEAEEEEEEEDRSRPRSSNGAIFDEGLYLIPLESEEEEEETAEEKGKEESEEEDSGIYVVSSVGGVVPKAPKMPATGEKKTSLRSTDRPPSGQKKKKKSSSRPNQTSGKKPAPKSGSKTGKTGSGKNSAAEEQFRAAMRNVSPEIRAAVKNDPVQRAALEQAVRIALVQQAAQEAVEKATGRPVFGGSSSAVSSKKKRMPKPPQRQTQQAVNSFLGRSSRAGSMSFSPITLRASYDDGGVSEFGVTEEKSSTASEFGTTAKTAGTTAEAAGGDNAAAAQTTAQKAPEPDSSQDAALEALTGKAGVKPHSSYQSPAAVRAAMRTGLDYDALQPSPAAAAAPKPAMSAAEQEMQAKRSGCLIWIIVAFIVFFVGLIAILILPNISKQNRYDKAVTLMESGNYLQAIEIFDDFGESDTKYYADSQVNISECAYEQALIYFSEGKYYDAYNLLMDKATVNDETKDLLYRSNYYYAEQRYAEGDWKTASAAYANLIGVQYEDSQEKYNICQYQLASQKAQEGNYLQAYQGFAVLGDYSDSRYRAACMIYQAWAADNTSVTSAQLADAASVLNENASNGEALDMLNGVYVRASEYSTLGNFTQAYETFSALGSYSDSAYKAALALYGVWSTDPSYGTLSQREQAMSELRARVGNEVAASALSSSGFNPVRMLGEWSDGTNYMSLQRVSPDSDELMLVLRVTANDGTVTSVESDHIGFAGNTVYRLTDPENTSSVENLFELTGFDSLVAMEPGSLSFYCILNNSEYEMQRA